MDTEIITSADKAKRVRAYEAQTTGTERWHKHPLGLHFTDGIAYMADTCGAYWLIDLVASHQPKVRRRLQALGRGDFQVWRIRQIEPKAGIKLWVVDAWTDTPELKASECEPGSRRLVRQTIGYSDFPEELSGFEWYVEGGVALLKGER